MYIRRVIIASLLIALFACTLAGCGADGKAYTKAESLLKAGQNVQAMKAFDALGAYRDAEARSSRIREQLYSSAKSLMDKNEFANAIKIFEQLDDYLDSKGKIEEAQNGITYNAATDLLGNKKYAEALAKFKAVEGYPGADANIAHLENVIIPYEDARRLIGKGEYKEALRKLEPLGDYKDSRELANMAQCEIAYGEAAGLYEQGEYGEALARFKAAAGYRDADQHIYELANTIIPYDDALRLVDDGKYEAALGKLEPLGGYKDASKYIRYCNANILKLKKDYATAYMYFKELNDFLDSEEKLADTDDALWLAAHAPQSVDGLEFYMSLPGVKNKDKALAERDSLVAAQRAAEAEDAFRLAMEAGTITALDIFLAQWSGSEYAGADAVERALGRIEELKDDGSLSAALLGNPKDTTSEMISRFLTDYPGHKDEQKVMALNAGDFQSLLKSGMISVKVKGNSITSTNVILTNNTKRDLKVTIPLGTYFDAESSSVQNMIVRHPINVYVDAGDSKSEWVDTACMNIRKDIPQEKNSFQASSLDGNSKLARVIGLCNDRNASYSVTQAAVWIVTDNPGDSKLLNTLVYSGGGSAISSDDLAEAKQIVKDAG